MYLQKTEINDILLNCNISADTIELYPNNGKVTSYLIDGKYILKISISALEDHRKLNRVKLITLVPKIHSFGTIVASIFKT